VSRSPERILARIAVIGALVAALGLAGCGRKGGLDPPPVAGVAVDPNAPPAVGPDGRPVAPQGQKRPIFLDWLID
jgi:predicted small lipoprotein YifL